MTRGTTHTSWIDPVDKIHPPGYGDLGFQSVIPLGPGPDDPAVVIVQYPPGRTIPVHSHDADYCTIVVAGEIDVTRRPETVGDIRIVRGGTAYGPLVVGPEGCTVIDVFSRRSAIPARFVKAADAAAASRPEVLAHVAQLLGHVDPT